MLRPSSGCNGSAGGGLTAAAIDGAPAAASLALADVFPVSQSGTLAKASVQQALNAIGLLAADAAPAESDMIPAVQGGVALYLAISALRAQLDKGVAGGRTVNGGTASTDTLTLANNALAVAKLTGVASATDYLQFTSSSTGGGEAGPKITATGSDPTVDLLLDTKGASSRVAWRINGTTKMDLNSGAGQGATLRVAGDIITQIGGGKIGGSNESLRVDNGGTWLDLEVGGAVSLRVSKDLGSGTGPTLFVPNLTVEPTANPASGVYLYAFGGALKARGASGTVTTIAAA